MPARKLIPSYLEDINVLTTIIKHGIKHCIYSSQPELPMPVKVELLDALMVEDLLPEIAGTLAGIITMHNHMVNECNDLGMNEMVDALTAKRDSLDGDNGRVDVLKRIGDTCESLSEMFANGATKEALKKALKGSGSSSALKGIMEEIESTMDELTAAVEEKVAKPTKSEIHADLQDALGKNGLELSPIEDMGDIPEGLKGLIERLQTNGATVELLQSSPIDKPRTKPGNEAVNVKISAGGFSMGLGKSAGFKEPLDERETAMMFRALAEMMDAEADERDGITSKPEKKVTH